MHFFERVIALTNDNVQTMIERYRRELIEFNKRNPRKMNENSQLNEFKSRAVEAAMEEKDEQNRYKTQTQADSRQMNDRQTDDRMMNDRQINGQPMNATRQGQSDYDIISEYENSRLYAELTAADNNPGISNNVNSNNRDRIRPYRDLTRLGPEAIRVMAEADKDEFPFSMNVMAANPEAAEDAQFNRNAERFPPYITGKGKTYKNIDEFLAENTKSGTLRVQAAAAEQSFPISNAEVVVSKDFEDGTHEFFRVFTDVSGIVSGMTLPAPDRAFSAYPTALAPYATYDISVSHPRYVTVLLKNCAIFDGVESIQYCEMVPTVASTRQFTVFEEQPTR